MRTTLTLDSEVAERLQAEARLGRRSFKEIVNDALRQGLGLERPRRSEPFRVVAHSSAILPGIDPAKLNQLADEMDALDFVQTPSRS